LDFQVTGTFVWYYCVCKRRVWLWARRINPDEDDSNIDIGRYIHEKAYSRHRKELDLGNAKIDLIKTENGQLVVAETKKSSRYLNASETQLLFYLLQLKSIGIEARGEVVIPTEKKKYTVELNESAVAQLNDIIMDIKRIANDSQAPPPVKIKACRNCAYSEFCWA
jgi:CRISPR-associated exonuclease Cas4